MEENWKWAIRGSQELVNLFNELRNKGTVKGSWNGDAKTMYYTIRDNKIDATLYDVNVPIITIKEFKEKYNIVVPEKWAIKVDQSKPEIGKWFDKNKAETSYGGYEGFRSGYLHYPSWGVLGGAACHQDTKVRQGYTEITFEQFKKHILKSEDKMDKKIIGYKLKEKYKIQEEGIGKMLGGNGKFPMFSNGINFEFNSNYYYKAKELGTLDLWFEPVYKIEREIVNYKVGDYLYCKKDFVMSHGGVEFTSGKLYPSESSNKLTNNSGNKFHSMSPTLDLGEGRKFEDYFRFATEEEIFISKLTVGTCVQILKTGCFAAGRSFGEIGDVVKISKIEKTPEGHNQYYYGEGTYDWFNDRYDTRTFMIIVPETMYKLKYESFKEGDLVYIEEGGCGAAGANGKIGKIIHNKSVQDGNGGSKIKVLIYNSVWGLNEREYSIRKPTQEELESLKNVTLTLGSGNISVKISKNSIVADNKLVTASSLQALYRHLSADFRTFPWEVQIPIVKIGCSVFTKEQINQILVEYDKINNTMYSK